MEPLNDQPNKRTKVIKLALVPVLAVVLGVLLFGQGDGDGATDGLAEPPNTDQSAVVAGDADRASLSSDAGDERAAVQRKTSSLRFSIEKVLDSNPFMLPAALIAPSDDAADAGSEQTPETDDAGSERDAEEEASPEMEGLAESLKQKTASIIVSGERGAVALIDSRRLAVGDYLQEGVRIVEIRSDGVIVEIEAPR